jgi:outer membrane lipoprotein-sorting protein
MLKCRKALCAVVVAALYTGTVHAETIEEVIEKLATAQTEVKSYSAKTKHMQDMDLGDGNKMKSQTEGTYYWMKKGDKFMFRTDMSGTSENTFGGQTVKSTDKTTSVCDGDHMYTLSEQDGQKHAMKAEVPPGTGDMDVRSSFSEMRMEQDLKVLPDETVDGMDCFVIEATPKAEEPDNPITRYVMYFDKKTGISPKSVFYDKAGKVAGEVTSTDVKVNVDIDPEKFVFKAPPGVEVMDMSAFQQQMGGQQPMGGQE